LQYCKCCILLKAPIEFYYRFRESEGKNGCSEIQ
jgi:hypothetical protein